MATKIKTYDGVWVCPRCSFTYNSPIEVAQVFHRCLKAKRGMHTNLKPRKGATT